MGLIYVPAEGRIAAANRFLPPPLFAPAAYGDGDETVALIAGERALGKTHGAAAASCREAVRAAPIEAQEKRLGPAAIVAALARMLSPPGWKWSGCDADPVEQLFLQEPVPEIWWVQTP